MTGRGNFSRPLGAALRPRPTINAVPPNRKNRRDAIPREVYPRGGGKAFAGIDDAIGEPGLAARSGSSKRTGGYGQDKLGTGKAAPWAIP